MVMLDNGMPNLPWLQRGCNFLGDGTVGRWDGGAIYTNLDIIWGMSIKRILERLQQVVFRTTDILRLVAFHSSILGFRVSDVVKEENGGVTATFMRWDPEHHSLGIFWASETGLDHFCSESTSWNDIRDWGDHFTGCQIPITWGAGRYGAGNNLFIYL